MVINFVLPSLGASGGIDVVYKYVELLIKHGHDVRVYKELKARNMYRYSSSIKNWAHQMYCTIKAVVLKNGNRHDEDCFVWHITDDTVRRADVVIATAWPTAFAVNELSSTAGNKYYFIQDYEPYFNLYGESYIMAQKSYEVGYHMVSLGKWNKHMIEKECNINSRLDYITFPYEGKEYFAKERNFDEYKIKKEFNFAVYIKDVGKRAPYLIQYLLTKLKKDFSEEGITLNIKYYGEDKNFKCEGGENIGKLSKSELLNLYNTSDFGLVASLTNISLVPYEMLATGLPVIEFKEGTFEYFFPEDTAIITSFDYNDFYNQVKEAINNTDKLKEMNKNSMKFLKELSWEKTTDEFIEILDMIGSEKGE